ncbi:FAD-dependent monooxygenase [Longimycelium tulufanense]|uniref:FAD-dependent monooxygenase n=1 Tax=Longimycelium tulufanense TaxID=907463 RepID=UPI001662AF4D|nr:FAD-dependent monooxygenase [Longimycelium tulufanense]
MLIAGGGPVGLATALELARFGVRSVVIEQRPGTSDHPKTRFLNSRTLEIARGWGNQVAGRLRGLDCAPEWKNSIRLLDSVVGNERVSFPTRGFAGPGSQITPTEPVMSSQDRFEPVLFDAAVADPHITLRFGNRVEALLRGGEPDATDVAVATTDVATGENTTLEGAALIAADGSDSFIRRALHIRRAGRRGVAHFINCYFRAGLESSLANRPANFYLVSSEVATGAFQPLCFDNRWLCQIAVSPDDWDLANFSNERLTEWIRQGTGVADLEVEILATTRWRMNATVAEQFTRGKVVLCGDAAHQLPPTGGLGVNTGIQGMHNVVWKLAYVLDGHAGEPLVHTYETERKNPARWAVEQSLDNYYSIEKIRASMLAGHGTEADPVDVATTVRRWGNQLGIEFGTVYDSGAIVPDGSAAPQADDPYSGYVPSATPGCRAPHLWLGNPQSPLSTLDLIGTSLTLLAAEHGHGWIAAADEVANRLDVPIARYRIGSEGLQDRDGRFCDLYGLAPDGAVLIRPDGYVAWRSASTSTHASSELSDAIKTLLHLGSHHHAIQPGSTRATRPVQTTSAHPPKTRVAKSRNCHGHR